MPDRDKILTAILLAPGTDELMERSPPSRDRYRLSGDLWRRQAAERMDALLRRVERDAGPRLDVARFYLEATFNGGLGWQQVMRLPNGPLGDFRFTNPSDGLLTVAGRVYLTRDGGHSWSRVSF